MYTGNKIWRRRIVFFLPLSPVIELRRRLIQFGWLQFIIPCHHVLLLPYLQLYIWCVCVYTRQGEETNSMIVHMRGVYDCSPSIYTDWMQKIWREKRVRVWYRHCNQPTQFSQGQNCVVNRAGWIFMLRNNILITHMSSICRLDVVAVYLWHKD